MLTDQITGQTSQDILRRNLAAAQAVIAQCEGLHITQVSALGYDYGGHMGVNVNPDTRKDGVCLAARLGWTHEPEPYGNQSLGLEQFLPEVEGVKVQILVHARGEHHAEAVTA